MERIEPTRKIALKVWWAMVWRYFLGLMLLVLANSLLMGIAAAVFKLDPLSAWDWAGVTQMLVVMPLTVLLSIEVVYRVLRSRFADFKIIIAGETEEERREDENLVEI